MVKKKDFSEGETNFFEKNGIKMENLKSRWDWAYGNPDLIKVFFYEVIYPVFNRIPDAQEIRKMGYRSFIRIFRELGGIWGEVKKSGNFLIPKKKKLKKKQSWRNKIQKEIDFFEKYDVNWKNLKSRWGWAYNNQDLIISFFQEIIYPLLGCVPKVEDIIKLGFRGIIQPIRKLGKTVTEINSEAFLGKEYDLQVKSTWRTFCTEEIEFFEKYDVDWRNLKSRWEWTHNPELIKSFFIEIIIPIKNRIPTIDELRSMGFRSLYEIIYDKFDYLSFINDISRELFAQEYSYVRNIPIGKIDEIEELAKNITDDFLYSEKIPRSINYFSGKLGLSWSTFSEHTIMYLEKRFGYTKGMELYDQMWENDEMRIQKIGIRSHTLINGLLTIFFENLGDMKLYTPIVYYPEPKIYLGGLHPDGLILLTQSIIKVLENLNPTFIELNLKQFKAIIFDFTIDSSKRNISKKILKYCRSDFLFLIVSLRDEYSYHFRPLPLPLQKQYHKLVKIMDHQAFLGLFDVTGILRVNFNNIINLISREDLEKLEKIKIQNSSYKRNYSHLHQKFQNL